ncbi:MAG: HAMP domain-containing sensor histidine kinase [Pseudomonadota bacterium]
MSVSRPLSMRARLLLAASLWCVLAVTITAVLLIELFRDHLLREADAELNDQLVELVSLTIVGRDGDARLAGSLPGTRFQRPFSGWSWQIRRGETVLLQSPSLGAVEPSNDSLLRAPAGAVGRFPGPFGAELRGLSRAVAPRFHTGRLIFAVARPQNEIDAAVGSFRQSVLVALGVLGAGLIGSILVVAWVGLRPLMALRDHIAAIRGGQEPPPKAWPGEIAPVAREIEDLRVHVERLVTRSRGQAADLAHAIKTPLSVIRQQADGLTPREAEALRRQADRIGLSLDRHLGRSHAAGTPFRKVDVAKCVDDLLAALQPGLSARGLEVERTIDPRAAFLGDEADFFEILGNPLDNARKWAATRILLTAQVTDGRLCLVIEDDGPGILEADRRAIMERGGRLDEAVPGHGLGLAILSDLVQLYDGRFDLGSGRLEGLKVSIDLPAA